MQLQANKRVVGMQDQVLGTYTFMLWVFLDMYWIYMIDLFLFQIVIDKAINWLSEFFSYLFCNCSHWFVRFVAQHCYVLGLCLMALGLHRRMLGLAPRGPGSNRNLVLVFANRLHTLLCLLTLACLMRLQMQCNRTIDTFVSK